MHRAASDSGDSRGHSRDPGSSDSDEEDTNVDTMDLQEAGDERSGSRSRSRTRNGWATDSQGEASTIAVKLHDKTRIGDSYQAVTIPGLRARTAEAKQEDLKIAPEEDHLLWDSSRAPDERRLQQLVKRLRIGPGRDDGGRPTSLLTHADVVAALHRCKYDPASAEASLVGLQRRRETKHKSASASSDARKLQHGRGDVSAEAATSPEDSATAQKSSNQISSIALGGEPYTGKSDVGGNRWEDWSEADRAAFLLHLGDKHKDMNDVAEEFATKSHGDVIEFYYNWKFHEPDYSRWQLMKRQIDIALTFPDFHQDICEACEEGGELLLCDTCSLAFHLRCLNPRLEEPPDNDWSCPECMRKHVTPETRARAKLFVKQRIVSIEEERRCMAQEEERRHERQALYGYLGQASAGIEHGHKRGGGASAPNAENRRQRIMGHEEAEAQAERELSNRPWAKEDLAQLQRAVDEFGERGWRAMMANEKHKSLFHMRSPFIVKSMHRMLKDNELKRAKARARMTARADTKAKARGDAIAGADGDPAKDFCREAVSFAEADAAAAAVAMARTEAHESVDHPGEEAGGAGTFDDKSRARERRALLQKLIMEHGVGGVKTKLDMPVYSALKEDGSQSALINHWRSMQHRLRRRLERLGMVPKRKPGRPPKNPPTQQYPGFEAAYPGSTNVGAPSTRATGNNERGDLPREEDHGGERSRKRARTEEKAENEQLPAASMRMQL
ncbi:unnamed protein product [Ectocarpus sp. 8 AP-2014]